MEEELFANFDFSLLDTPDFKEDSVREELIVPILARLGYSASTDHKIIRSKGLTHPFVYIGTAKKDIKIIPDYLLQFNGENFFILDAKGPKENIASGKNVEQAFSYAIHPEVRVRLYALCNGRDFVVFDVSRNEPIFLAPLNEIAKWIHILDHLLGVTNRIKRNPKLVYKPDFGLYLIKSGLAASNKGEKIGQIFLSLPVLSVATIEKNLYSINSLVPGLEGQELMITFDFSEELYQKFLEVLTVNQANLVRERLSRQPFSIHFEVEESFPVGVVAEIGNVIMSNEDESYCPMSVLKFTEEIAV